MSDNRKKIQLTKQFSILRPGVYEICDSVHYAGIEVYAVGFVQILLVVGYCEWEAGIKAGIVAEAPIDNELKLDNYEVRVGPHGVSLLMPTDLGGPILIEHKEVT